MRLLMQVYGGLVCGAICRVTKTNHANMYTKCVTKLQNIHSLVKLWISPATQCYISCVLTPTVHNLVTTQLDTRIGSSINITSTYILTRRTCYHTLLCVVSVASMSVWELLYIIFTFVPSLLTMVRMGIAETLKGWRWEAKSPQRADTGRHDSLLCIR